MAIAPVLRYHGGAFTGLTYGLLWLYVLALLALFLATGAAVSPARWWEIVTRPEILAAIGLTLGTSLVSTAIAVALALPVAYRLARSRFPGKALVDALVDLPMVLSPLVIGLGLLLFFASAPGHALERWLEDALGLRLRFAVAGIVLGQVLVAASFAIRALRAAFEQVDISQEEMAQALGCGPWGVFRRIALPGARRGVLVAATLTWARAVGEFGPILVFVGIVPFRTEVLSTALYLGWSGGDLEAAAVVASLMIALAVGVVVAVRWLGRR